MRFQPTFGCNHSNIISRRIMVNLERQTFLYYHVYLLQDIKLTGYAANNCDNRKLTFATQNSTLWIKHKKSNLDIDKTFRALKMITWLFSAHHTEKRLNADYTLFFKLNWKIFKFFEIKICSQQNLISPKRVSNGRFLPVIFLKEHKREDDK